MAPKEGQGAVRGAGEDEPVLREEDLASLGGELVRHAEEGAREDEAGAGLGEGGVEVRAAAEGVGAGAAPTAVPGVVVGQVESVLDDEPVVRPLVIPPADDEICVFEDLGAEFLGEFQERETTGTACVIRGS